MKFKLIAAFAAYERPRSVSTKDAGGHHITAPTYHGTNSFCP